MLCYLIQANKRLTRSRRVREVCMSILVLRDLRGTA